ncbi:NADPH-dependent FMN reductase [Pseudomonas sp. BF-RE-26]|uniref:NADPH-dependent FMN reductase n=1 Tax=Pseudomonas sp. BF-RE-26 TaxID=2832396 RepID=UPI001CBEE1C5|nr:NADPH-dependent FMN reductase [Pseudomonas sp. BF-RE-26]
MLRIALIVGSTRPNRFADKPVEWLVEGAKARTDVQLDVLDVLDVLDLREADLPFFEESIPPSMLGGVYSHPKAEAWRRRIGEYDGYIATVAEYNHGPTGVLKNALDSAFLEWNRKPIGFVGYGGVGGARAIEQLRGIAVEMQMPPLKHEVNIAREPFMGVLTQSKTLNDYDYLVQSRTDLFDNLVWWAEALKVARTKLRLVQ